ncbi:hypothetical protein ACFL9T_23130 [Thermodesulfobacteriota bacterium]
MEKRPTSVTVVGWILIIMSGISLITSTLTLNSPATDELMSQSPMPIFLQYAIMYLGLLITLVSGIAMLKGGNWARFLYVIWSVVGFMIGLATSPVIVMMIPGFVIFVIVTVFLFRPKANQYFRGNEAQIVTESI